MAILTRLIFSTILLLCFSNIHLSQKAKTYKNSKKSEFCHINWEYQLLHSSMSFDDIKAQFYNANNELNKACAREFKQFMRTYNQYGYLKNNKGKSSQNSKILKEYFKSTKQESVDNNKSINSKWSNLGSYNEIKSLSGFVNGSGRVNVVVFDPNNNDRWFAGTPNGGIWMSENRGKTWFATTTDDLPILGVSDIIFDPFDTDIMYAVSGDRDKYSMTAGLLKSTDQGFTWEVTSFYSQIPNLERVYRIMASPLNPGHFLVATFEGVYKTQNNMLSWNLTTLPSRFRHMQFDKSNPNLVFATTEYDGNVTKLYRSVDFGSTWNEILLPGNTDIRRAKISIDSNNSNDIYICGVNSFNFSKLYKSNDSGNSFFEISPITAPNLGGQVSYNLGFTISPHNSDILFMAGVIGYKSTDGGLNWENTTNQAADGSYVHVDHHFFTWDPDGNLISANDGGIWQSNLDTGQGWTSLNTGICNGELYRLESSNANELIISTGTQDMGTYVRNNVGNWNLHVGGDGVESIIDPVDNNIVFSTLHDGRIYKTSDGGISGSIVFNDWDYGEATGFFFGFTMDPNSNRLLVGVQSIFESIDDGDTWTNISGPITTSSSLQDIVIAPSNSSFVYTTDFNNIFRSVDSGFSWTTLPSPDPTNSFRRIEVDPNDENTIYVTSTSGQNGSIYKSTDGGNSWSDITMNLPVVLSICSIPSNDESIFVGTRSGVYYKNMNLSTWELYGDGLPTINVSDMDYFQPENKLRIATYGRGVWEIKLDNLCPNLLFVHGTLKTEVVEANEIISDGISIMPNTNTVFEYGTSVTLKEKFEIQQGKTFETKLTGCN